MGSLEWVSGDYWILNQVKLKDTNNYPHTPYIEGYTPFTYLKDL